MIIDVKKVVFFGVRGDLDRFFDRAQQKGIVEFIPQSNRKNGALSPGAQAIMAALKALRGEATMKETAVPQGTNPIALAREITALKSEQEKLEEEKRILFAEKARIAPLGHFSLQDIADISRESNYHVQFFCVKTAKGQKDGVPDELIYLATEYDMDYYLSLQKDHVAYPGMIEMHIDRSLSEIEGALDHVQNRLREVHRQLLYHSGHVPFLKESLIDQLNDSTLTFAKREVATSLDEAIFSVQGWVPSNQMEALTALTDALGIGWEEIAVEASDRVPTHMENKSFGSVGEDLVNIYDTPSTTDKDPSKWVFWSFAIFFAIIVADAGYGALYLTLALFLRKKLKSPKPFIKRSLTMMTTLATCCVAWGVLTASYFGMQLPPDALIARYSLTETLAIKKAKYHLEKQDDVYQVYLEEYPSIERAANGYDVLIKGKRVKEGKEVYEIRDEFESNVLLEIALVIGIIHISLSLLRYVRRNVAAIGWIIALIGGYLYFPIYLNATSMVHYLGLISKTTAALVGMQLLIGGGALAILIALIQHKLRGFAELTKVIEIFADILSYLRLYALGLAGMMLGATFNDLGVKVGFIPGIAVILLGHSINMAIGIMGGVIHGLRLNFIEWYHYSFEGGGKPFKPLALVRRYYEH